jgi:hypothetical protein
VRYTLGHTLASILTLQSIHTQNHGGKYEGEDASLSTSDAPLSRRPANSLRVLYAHLGLRIFAKGLFIAAIYQLLKTVVTSMLTATILRPVGIGPLADIVAMVLLAEAHMYWTHATISTGKSNLRVRSWTHSRTRWKKLVLPCAAQGSAVALLDWASRSLPDMSGASNSDVSRTLSAIAVLRAFVALIVRSFVLAPAAAWLTLVEASCLDLGQETLVYERAKKRFVSGGAVFARYEQRSSRELWKGVSLHLCLWLLELHVKKCAVQMVLEGLVASIVRLVA